MTIITTILLVLLLLLTLYRWLAAWTPIGQVAMQELDIFLLPCWVGFGIYHLFW